MPPPPAYRTAFIEPSAHTDRLAQLLGFEGITVGRFARQDVHQLPAFGPDLLVLNQMRLRAGTLPLSVSVVDACHVRPLTLAIVAQGDEMRGVELVERGLDGFIAGSCGAREFVARVRALLRRAKPEPSTRSTDATAITARPVRISELDIDPARRRARICGRDLRLTEQEFQLLYFLAGNPGRVFDRQALLDAVWGSDTFVTVRSVDALVKRVRHQLRAVGRLDDCVETVRGVGYRMADLASPDSLAAL
jgi:DNA-binding response OmpR family regulator